MIRLNPNSKKSSKSLRDRKTKNYVKSVSGPCYPHANNFYAMIRKHLVDKLGTSMEIKERNIELHASVSASETPYGFTATFTITDATQA